MSSSNVVGVVVLFRHGDRQGYYQDPSTYTASDTLITPLGSLQEYHSGLSLAQRYLKFNESQRYIQGIQWPKLDLEQVDFKADSSEGQVIVDSANALAQGLFPANVNASTITLANGTSVTTPLGGYVYVPIETVEADEDISLEGFTDCPAFVARTSRVYNTTAFKAIENDNIGFLSEIKPLVGNRNVAFSNMYNVFDYMNVNNIHNETFHKLVTQQQMNQSRALANYHEQAVFTDSTPDGIGNIAGQTILPPILDALSGFGEADNKLKMLFLGIAYKPFFSLFNMTQVGIDGMVDYASVLAFEVTNSSGTLEVSFNFRNGTPAGLDGNDLVTYPMFGSNSNTMSLDTFISNLSPYAIPDLGTWCNKCENTKTRGCDVIAAVNATDAPGSITSTRGKQDVSPVVAGVIGALLGIVVAVVFMIGGELLRRRRAKKTPYARGGSGGGAARESSFMGDSQYELTSPPADHKDGAL